MHSWIVKTERILAAEWGEPNEVLTTEQIAHRFDRWACELEHLAQSGTLSPDEQRCLEHYLHVTQCQRAHLLHRYEGKGCLEPTMTWKATMRQWLLNQSYLYRCIS